MIPTTLKTNLMLGFDTILLALTHPLGKVLEPSPVSHREVRDSTLFLRNRPLTFAPAIVH